MWLEARAISVVDSILANPFRPTFGTSPPLLVGRDEMLLAFHDALAHGPGAPGRATLYTGARGAGKTVLLNEIEDVATRAGWVAVSETASAGLVHRLVTEGLPTAARKLEFPSSQRRVTGLHLPMSMGGVEVDVHERNRPEPGLRTQLTALTDHLDKHQAGLLLTIDEVHTTARADLREIALTVQHCFREQRPIAFAAAGLPSAVQDILNDDILTFLRRADRHTLGAVDPADVADALAGPIQTAGRTIDPDALEAAVAAAGGYPFLIQLIGYWIWRSATNTGSAASRINLDQVNTGVIAARRRMGSLVHEPALTDLSTVDRTFLAAMANDTGPSAMADIADRLATTVNYASQYRLRLIAAGMIQPAGRGYVTFALPYLREYLHEHAANYGL